MAERGLCSRREADDWIARGWVFVEGQQIKELGTRIAGSEIIEVSEHAKREQGRFVTILLNKPIGWVSAQPEDNYRPAIELLGPENEFIETSETTVRPPQTSSSRVAQTPSSRVLDPRRLDQLAVAGRLDIDSQGLLVFTQDGRIAKQLIGQNSPVEKEYLVRLKQMASPAQLKELQMGRLQLDGKALKTARAEVVNADQIRMILTEGRKRQVRRMCELVGLQVIGLKRVRIGRIPLGRLPEGKWRYLLPNESF